MGSSDSRVFVDTVKKILGEEENDSIQRVPRARAIKVYGENYLLSRC